MTIEQLRETAAGLGYKLVPVKASQTGYDSKLALLITLAALTTDGMTDKQVHAHYARIAAFEDVRTFLKRDDLSDGLRQRADALLTRIVEQNGKHTPATKAEYKALHQAWRAERNTSDRAFGFVPTRGIVLAETEAA